MNIEINQKEMTALTAAKAVFASVIEDVYTRFSEYAPLFVENWNELSEIEIKEIFNKREKVYDSLNKAVGKDKLL